MHLHRTLIQDRKKKALLPTENEFPQEHETTLVVLGLAHLALYTLLRPCRGIECPGAKEFRENLR